MRFRFILPLAVVTLSACAQRPLPDPAVDTHATTAYAEAIMRDAVVDLSRGTAMTAAPEPEVPEVGTTSTTAATLDVEPEAEPKVDQDTATDTGKAKGPPPPTPRSESEAVERPSQLPHERGVRVDPPAPLSPTVPTPTAR